MKYWGDKTTQTQYLEDFCAIFALIKAKIYLNFDIEITITRKCTCKIS